MKSLKTLFAITAFALAGCDTTDPEPPVTSSYEHERPAWSPDGGSVAFTAIINGVLGIYAVDTSGSNVRMLHEGDALGLSWSPDGQQIAYSQSNQIFRVSVLQDIPQLVVTQAPSIRPSWSPDGQSIAYVRDGLRIVQVLTGDDRRITISGTSPSWSADGTQLVGYDQRTDAYSGGYTYSVFRVHKDSLIRSDLFSITTYDNCGFFSLSPDERTVVYSRKPAGAYAQVRSVSLNLGNEVGLTTDGGDYPAISFDGEWIVYTRPTSGDGGLWLMRMDGSGKRRLTQP